MSDAYQLAGYLVLTFALGAMLGAAIAMNGMFLWIRSRLRKAIKIYHEASASLDEAIEIMKDDDQSSKPSAVDEAALAEFLAREFQTDFVDEDNGGPNAFATEVAESVGKYLARQEA